MVSPCDRFWLHDFSSRATFGRNVITCVETWLIA
jgi:hypothetical protein